MPHNRGDVLLVGSVPRESAAEVFGTCATILSDHLQSMPDGEIGVRKSWIQCQAILVFDKHPAIETVHRPQSADGLPTEYADNWIFRLKPGTRTLEFGDLGYARWAVESYEIFRGMRDRKEIPGGMRFQVSLPTPLAGCVSYFDQPADRELVYRAYEPAMMRAAREICRRIPAEDLALQWDICLEILEIATGRAFLDSEPWNRTSEQFERIANAVPAAAMLGYHFCYGDLGHHHLVEPEDLALCVRMANLAISRSSRRVDWLHMPVPINRSDDAYFAPLGDLKTNDGKVYLGLVHYHDGVAGALARAKVARRYLPQFGIATECGLGRRSPETLIELLTIHREVAERLAITD